MQFAELHCTSNFSLLRGASHPEELVHTASTLGYRAVALTDHNSLAGVVRAHTAAKALDFKFHVGCRLNLIFEELLPAPDDYYRTITVFAYPTNRAAYGNLCRLLTLGKRRSVRGVCLITLSELFLHHTGLVLTLFPAFMNGTLDNLYAVNVHEVCKKIYDAVPLKEYLSIGITRTYSHNNPRHAALTAQIANHLRVPLIATNDVFFHTPDRRPLCDLLYCIRERKTVQEAGFLLFQNGERYLKPVAEMVRLFRDLPEALHRTLAVSEMVEGFSLDLLRYEYPNEILPEGRDALQYLTELTWSEAQRRYPGGVPEKVRKLIKDELILIHELSYEKYFLTCYDIVRFAREREILCQGRGAAANSAVCFALGITSVDPEKIDLLFARFVSKERDEPPDIDIDFEHERREEVIQYIYNKYGRERAGLTCVVVTYQPRSAVRDVGKALGLSLEIVDKLAKSIHRWTACELSREALLEIGVNPDDSTIQNTLQLTHELLDFPRHLSQHVGGFIISEHPLCETVPILNATMPDRTIIEWNKDDIDALGMLKIDILGLGMLSCIRKAFEFINRRRLREGGEPVALHSLPSDNPEVYKMVCAADTIGVFQIESRAQMSMLPRLRPRCFYDLVIEVAIVRPGPIQGNMVHPYLKRRNGLEPVSFPDERVAAVLGKTLGVPIFQEQAMRLAIVLANFTPGEAEMLRRAMAAWRSNKDLIARFKERIVGGMVKNGYTAEFAETCMHQIRGFSEYGFPESHAASFALLVYASAWIKCHYPAEFAAALINSQPMGFYAPAQIIQDAKNHGISVLPIDINYSKWDCTIDNEREGASLSNPAVRLGMRLVRGLSEPQVLLIVDAIRIYGKVTSIHDLWMRCHRDAGRLRKATLRSLANADAFGSLALSRREALWEIQALPPEPLPLDEFEAQGKGTAVPLPSSSMQQEMFADYTATGFSLKAHPLQFLRAQLKERGVYTAGALKELVRDSRQRLPSKVSVAGIAIFRQRPGTAKGVVFITLEDETGIVNLIIRPKVFEEHTKLVLSSSVILAHGFLEHIGNVVYINTLRLESLDRAMKDYKGNTLPHRSYSY